MRTTPSQRSRKLKQLIVSVLLAPLVLTLLMLLTNVKLWQIAKFISWSKEATFTVFWVVPGILALALSIVGLVQSKDRRARRPLLLLAALGLLEAGVMFLFAGWV